LVSSRYGSAGALIVPSYLRSRSLGLIVCICALLIGTQAWQLWRVHEANLQQAEATTSNMAEATAAQVETVIKTADTIVASLVERVEANGTGPEARARLYRLMTSLAATLPAVQEIAITDGQGNAIVKSLVANPARMNYADQDYFRFHAAHHERGPFIGARIKSKEDGTDNITVTRQIDRADGSLDGVVFIRISLQFFQQLFDQMQATSGDVVTLLAEDGTILARSPSVTSEANAFTGSSELRQRMHDTPRAGTVTYRSSIDSEARIGSYQQLSQYPLTILVSQSRWDIQSGWRAELLFHAMILACVLVIVAMFVRRVVKGDRVVNRLAKQDGLTGLTTRSVFDEAIELEFRRAARSGEPVAVVMIDIDHFKAYNDCYGHTAGDACLLKVAQTVQGHLRRAGDLAARYDSEEIALILPRTDAAHAHAFAQKMRLAVRDLAMPHERSSYGLVTFSAGVAACVPGRSPGAWRALVADADAALYLAKGAGRDTVATCPPSAEISTLARVDSSEIPHAA
jgi:diguanylate cyclase (GGDEF)-like protein